MIPIFDPWTGGVPKRLPNFGRAVMPVGHSLAIIHQTDGWKRVYCEGCAGYAIVRESAVVDALEALVRVHRRGR